MVQLLTEALGGPLQMIATVVIGICVVVAVMINEIMKMKKVGSTETKVISSASEAEQKDEQKAECSIIFGTQTGTAEKFAKTLKSQLESAYGSTTMFHLVDAENYNAKEMLLKEKFVIFLVATYGDGEPTDSAVELHDYLVEASEDVDVAEPPMEVRGLFSSFSETICASCHRSSRAYGTWHCI